MMFYITVSTVFLIQILTTRSLNRGRLTSRLWHSIWTVELTFLGLMLSALVLGYTAFARWAMTAGVSVFLLRAAVRGYDYGLVKLTKKALPVLRTGLTDLGSAIGEITTVIVSFFAAVSVAFIKALPEAMADEVGSDEMNSDSVGMSNPFNINSNNPTGVNEWDYSKTDWEW